MFADARSTAVLALADELAAEPSMLAEWAQAISGRDDVTLVVHPGSCPADQVVATMRSTFQAAGIADDASTAHVLLVPADAECELELAESCTAIYTGRGGGEHGPFSSLRPVGRGAPSSIRDAVLPRGPLLDLAAVSPRWHTARVNDTWDFVHRNSEADLSVLCQIFRDQCYSLEPFKGRPGLGRYEDVGALGGRPLVVDCGANIGVSSAYFAIRYPAARIVALEPEKENYSLLVNNVRAFPSVRPLNAAIAARAGMLDLYDPGTGEWGYRTERAGCDLAPIGRVEATSLEQVVAMEPGTVPFVLKVDIEGAEADLFSGDTKAIDKFPVVMIELHDWMLPGQGTSDNFLRWHVSQDRDLVYRGENIFSLSRSLCREPALPGPGGGRPF